MRWMIVLIRWLLPLVGALGLWLAPAQRGQLLDWELPYFNPGQGEGTGFHGFDGWADELQTMEGGTGRRAEQRAGLALNWAHRLGDPLLVEVRACRCGSPGSELVLDGHVRAPLAGEGWQTYRLLVPATPTIYERDLFVEWLSPQWGPLLQSIEVQALEADGRAEGAALLLLALLGVAAMTRRERARGALLWMALLLASASAGRWLYAPQLLPWSALVLIGALAALALTAWTSPGRRPLMWALVLWLLAAPQLLGTWVLDDAFISFRYARNLVEGHGITFNPGERVEGYTNYLWTMIIGAALKLGYEPVVAAQLLTTMLSVATVLMTERIAAAWWPEGLWSVLPALLLSIFPPFVLYTSRGSGMEPALVTCLTVAALWAAWQARSLRGGILAGALAALVMLARPDGALVPMASGMLLLLRALRGDPARRPALLALGGLVGAALLIYGPYFAWRYSYYGYLLPNTFYAKVGATEAQLARGVSYAGSFFSDLGLAALLLPLALSLAATISRRVPAGLDRKHAALLWVMVALTLAYTVAVGGDHFPLGRFFIPILPALALLVMHGLAVAWRRRASMGGRALLGLAGLAACALVALNAAALPATDSRIPDQPIWSEAKVTEKNVNLGHWFRLNTPPDSVVATGIAGAMPYYGERYVIDTLGLNDLYIAHLEVATMGQGEAGAEKTDTDYILSKRPDYIPLSSAGQFLQDQRFKRRYEMLTVDGPIGGVIRIYQRMRE